MPGVGKVDHCGTETRRPRWGLGESRAGHIWGKHAAMTRSSSNGNEAEGKCLDGLCQEQERAAVYDSNPRRLDRSKQGTISKERAYTRYVGRGEGVLVDRAYSGIAHGLRWVYWVTPLKCWL
jgi:hypothetical protein